MVALSLWRDSRCHRCGGDLAETTSPDNDGTPGNGAYIPIAPLRCHRCAGLVTAEDNFGKNDRSPRSLIHRVEYRPPRHTH